MVVGAPVDARALDTRPGHLPAFLIGKAASCIVAVPAWLFFLFDFELSRLREREKLIFGP
jgi:hypothetical protein